MLDDVTRPRERNEAFDRKKEEKNEGFFPPLPFSCSGGRFWDQQVSF